MRPDAKQQGQETAMYNESTLRDHLANNLSFLEPELQLLEEE